MEVRLKENRMKFDGIIPLIFLLVLIRLCKTGHSLYCYECKVEVSPDEEPTDPCSMGDPEYMKKKLCSPRYDASCVILRYDRNSTIGMTTIERDCYPKYKSNDCDNFIDDLSKNHRSKVVMHTCTACYYDECNTGFT